MKVFEVRTASDDFRTLAFDQRGMASDDVVKFMDDLECRGRRKEKWAPPPMRMTDPFKPEPDFWCCTVPGAFAVQSRALSKVSTFFEKAGQMLPLKVQKTEFTVLNILQVVDCIDLDRSERYTMPSTGEKYRVRKPFFVPEHFEASTLFKIPERELHIYCWEHNRDPEEEFKACVEANNLTGLIFKLVWTDEQMPSRKGTKKQRSGTAL